MKTDNLPVKAEEASLANHKARKSNEDIGYALIDGQMPFLMRKLYNSIIYHSQKLSAANKGVMPQTVEWDFADYLGTDPSKYFWIQLNELVSDSSAGNDYKNIRALLENMMRVLVVRGDPTGTNKKTHLLGPVIFVNTVGPKPAQRSGTWMIGWRFDDEDLEAQLLNPSQYTPISLYYQSQLKSGCALALYEICRRRVGQAMAIGVSQATTASWPWEEWQARLITDSTPRKEFKHFNRDFLKPAIEQINGPDSTDITIEMYESKRPGTRAVEKISFRVELRAQASLGLPKPDGAIPTALLDKLEAVGVTSSAADKLLAEFGEDRVSSNLKHYLTAGEGKGAGWLVAAIRDDYASAEAKKKQAKTKQLSVAKKAAEKQLTDSGDQVVSQFKGVDLPVGDELLARWAEFKAAPNGKLFKGLPKSHADADTKQQQAFVAWLASQQ